MSTLDQFNKIISSFEESIFSKMTKMAMEYHAVNLAQGFPDFDGPDWIFELAQKSFSQHKNQYSPSMGLLNLRQSISQQYEKFYNLSYCPKEEILITNGATEALYLALTALTNPNDEVVLFEPFYDSYLAALQCARTKNIILTLKAPNFAIDFDELSSVLTTKTKFLILNNPHNPTGKVFTKSELLKLAELSEKFDFLIISDEVYEFLTYDCAHIPTACVTSLKNRVVTISSIGKTLSLTGWKIGWAAGPKEVISVMHKLHQFTTFCVVTPLQDAVAQALPKLDNYLLELKRDYKKRKVFLSEGLQSLGFKVLPSQGSYFLLVEVPEGRCDQDFAEYLLKNKKVASIPVSAFYQRSEEGKRYIRLCYAKTQDTLQAALNNLKSR